MEWNDNIPAVSKGCMSPIGFMMLYVLSLASKTYPSCMPKRPEGCGNPGGSHPCFGKGCNSRHREMTLLAQMAEETLWVKIEVPFLGWQGHTFLVFWKGFLGVHQVPGFWPIATWVWGLNMACCFWLIVLNSVDFGFQKYLDASNLKDLYERTTLWTRSRPCRVHQTC